MLEANEMASLHNHTDKGSLLDSTLTIDQLVKQAKDLNYKAVGISEHGTMHTYVDFYKACKEHDIKGIIGVKCTKQITYTIKKLTLKVSSSFDRKE